MSTQTATSPVHPNALGRKTTVTAPEDQPIIIIQRMFPAPPCLVFEATTRPEHVRRWYGCGSMTMPVCEMDVRVGGKYRYALADGEGNVFAWHGEYLEVEPPHRVVCTEIFEGFPDAVATVTAHYEDVDGHTRLTSTVVHQSMANRDGHLASGMEDGVVQTYARLEKLLLELR